VLSDNESALYFLCAIERQNYFFADRRILVNKRTYKDNLHYFSLKSDINLGWKKYNSWLENKKNQFPLNDSTLFWRGTEMQ